MRLFIVAVLVAALSGCASSPSGERIERLGIQLFVMNRVIEQSGDRVGKAQEILSAVAELRTMLDFQTIAVVDLREAMLRRISRRNLEPSERLIALELVNEIATFVESKVGAGDLSPEMKVTVNKVLSYIESAALIYVS